MTTNWHGVSQHCRECGVFVGDFKLERRKGGKNLGKSMIIGKPNEKFGSFIKKKGKSEMECICRSCQKA